MHVLLSPGAPYVPGTPATERAVDVLRRLLEQCPDPVFADEEAQPGAADTTGIPVLCPDQMRRHWEAAVRHGGTPAQPSAFPVPGTFCPGADEAQEEETVGTPQLLRQWTAHSKPRGLTGTPPQLNLGPSSPSRPGTAALEPYGGFFRNPIETSLSREGNRENETRSARNEAVFIQQDEPRHSRSGTTSLRFPGEEDSGNMQQGQNNLSALSAIDVVRSPSVLSFCDAAAFDSDLESRQQQEDRQEAAALNGSNFSDLPLPVDRSAADHEEESFVERMVERSGIEHQGVLEAPSTTARGDEEEKEERHQGEQEEEKEDRAYAAPQPRGASRRQDGGYRIRTAPAASAAAAAATAADSAPPAGDRGPERSLDLGNRDPHGRWSCQEKEEEEVGGNGTDRRAPSRSCNGLKRCRGVIGCCYAPCRSCCCCCCCCSREGTEEEQEVDGGCEEALTSHGSRKQRCRGRSRPVEVSVRLSGDGSAVVVEVPGSSGGSSPGLQQITLRPVTTGSTGLPETSHLGGYTDSRRAEEGGGGEEGRQQEGPGHRGLGGSTRSSERQLDLSNHDATSGALMALLGRKGEGSSAQQGGASCDLSRALLKACRPPPGPSSA